MGLNPYLKKRCGEKLGSSSHHSECPAPPRSCSSPIRLLATTVFVLHRASSNFLALKHFWAHWGFPYQVEHRKANLPPCKTHARSPQGLEGPWLKLRDEQSSIYSACTKHTALSEEEIAPALSCRRASTKDGNIQGLAPILSLCLTQVLGQAAPGKSCPPLWAVTVDT